MPPRSQPKIHQIQLRSHKLTIMITVPPSTTIAAVKEEAFSALVSDVNRVEDIPTITSDSDFEVCRAIKDKGKLTGEYEVMDVSKQLREYNMGSWETLYLQFRDSSGDLLPVTFTQPSIEDEDEGLPEPEPEPEQPTSSTSKGKRKAHFDD